MRGSFFGLVRCRKFFEITLIVLIFLDVKMPRKKPPQYTKNKQKLYVAGDNAVDNQSQGGSGIVQGM